MACYLEKFDGTTISIISWHLGESQSFHADSITSITADCDEANSIRAMFTVNNCVTIPFSAVLPVQRWYGSIARTIAYAILSKMTS